MNLSSFGCLISLSLSLSLSVYDWLIQLNRQFFFWKPKFKMFVVVIKSNYISHLVNVFFSFYFIFPFCQCWILCLQFYSAYFDCRLVYLFVCLYVQKKHEMKTLWINFIQLNEKQESFILLAIHSSVIIRKKSGVGRERERVKKITFYSIYCNIDILLNLNFKFFFLLKIWNVHLNVYLVDRRLL